MVRRRTYYDKFDKGMGQLDRGMDRIDRAMEKLDRKIASRPGVTIRNVTQSGRGRSIVTKGSKIIIDGEDVTEKLNELKGHDFMKDNPNMWTFLRFSKYAIQGIIIIVMFSMVIFGASMIFDMITEAEHKPKTLDAKPPIVQPLPDEQNPVKIPSAPAKRL